MSALTIAQMSDYWFINSRQEDRSILHEWADFLSALFLRKKRIRRGTRCGFYLLRADEPKAMPGGTTRTNRMKQSMYGGVRQLAN